MALDGGVHHDIPRSVRQNLDEMTSEFEWLLHEVSVLNDMLKSITDANEAMYHGLVELVQRNAIHYWNIRIIGAAF
ncbi:hypothetical protein SNOG_09883 [Parastagonospora nodorum SN15]|uniref:Uncharacterized protein n=1 Tax=Phaeosphaeria nodorum (strain SN15 / ATCC MYA-4574 / FGSC 10173) TaxID=321614 RepID=Q0UED1_PHANO|nr:hypothetical protein SNOG_09883 [Parastagonospora nodorum SN15]EAT83148.1 hypothetical protein SNOG_09883 [Parastagonospora nodorum SN15]